jgi:invasion protein IalB
VLDHALRPYSRDEHQLGITMRIIRRAAFLALTSVGLLGADLQGAQAQTPASKKDQKGAQPAAPSATAPPSKDQSAWVKVCETATFKIDNKEEKKKVCLTHHERLDANTGMVLVSAAIREVEGQPKPALIVMLPLGMALLPGVQAKIDSDTEILKFPFTLCHPAGCTAEVDATPEMLTKFKSGKELMVAAMNVSGSPLGFPVPLTGFGPALDGQPLDNQKYVEARKGLMEIIKRRQAELAGKKQP